MSNLNKKKIEVFSALGAQLSHPHTELSQLIENEHLYNPWFTQANVEQAVKAIGQMLTETALTDWLSRYPVKKQSKRIGLILAGNIPLVGFHDILCVMVSGNFAMIKTSSQDSRLIKYILNQLVKLEQDFGKQFSFVERLENFDAIIATGSNNSSRYFDYYFGKVPNLIRKNRNSIAFLTGSETTNQLHALGHDIFDYFGLGCRNVSKVLVPHDYNFVPFFEAIESFNPIANHHKYRNNYDYNKSIYLVNGDKHLDNGFLLVKEDERIASPLAVLYYQSYDTLDDAVNYLLAQQENIQCVVDGSRWALKNQEVDFGKTQQPGLSDYADGVDTMEFLINL